MRQLRSWLAHPLTKPLVGALALMHLAAYAVSAWAATLDVKQYNSFVVDGTTLASDPIANKFAVLLAGYDGTNYRAVRTDAAGNVATGSAGSDVTLGTFTQTGGTATQIFLAGSNMPAAGATKAGVLIVSTPNNTDLVFVGETAALAAASNNPMGAVGQDSWYVPVGGKVFFLSNSGTQTVSARFRS